MAQILIVDDSLAERRHIAGVLRSAPELVVMEAEGAGPALDYLRDRRVDLVITDLLMPTMTGLDLLRQVRRLRPELPVVLLTAYGSEEIAVEAIQSGAAGYVPKARQAERLVETVRHVLARRESDRHRKLLMCCLAHLRCSFLLESDPDLVAAAVDLVQQTLAAAGFGDVTERIRVAIALEEALLNALFHGTLELTASEALSARNDLTAGRTSVVIEERRRQRPMSDRRIHLDVEVAPQRVQIRVRDKGRGFDVPTLAGGQPIELIESDRCRGILLMRSFMDEVAYNDLGNEVILVKHGLASGAHE
jgi:DNA-binding NarL/FixJ family response regulator